MVVPAKGVVAGILTSELDKLIATAPNSSILEVKLWNCALYHFGSLHSSLCQVYGSSSLLAC